MSDKVQKIREELEKLREQLQDKVETSDFIAGEVFIMNYFLTFIDSLQEDPVRGLDNGDMSIERWKQAVAAASNQKNYRSSKGLTETRDDYFVDGVQWADDHAKEEPVSGDLEKTAMQYGTNEFPSLCSGCKHVPIDAFKAGAKWQKEKDDEEKELTYKHGFEDCKEQLIKDAINEIARHDDNEIL